MKYGILTFHETGNFGATLQAYALCKKIKDLGVDCEIIDYRCANVYQRECRTSGEGKSIINNIGKYFLIQPQKKKKCSSQKEFLHRTGMLSSNRYVRQTIAEANERYDAFISGSDQVWNLKITDNDMTYMLDFVDDDKLRYSYASSVGYEWSQDEFERVKNALLRYKILTVREQDTSDYLNQRGHFLSRCVCDPTMLLSADEWKQLLGTPYRRNYVLVYYPNETLLSAAREYADKHRKQIIVINIFKPIRGVINERVMKVQDFLTLIFYADMIFTDSFHGMVFSLYYQKKFWVTNKSNRVQSILKKLELEDRYLDSSVNLDKEIVYAKIENKIERIRDTSVSVLTEIVTNEK